MSKHIDVNDLNVYTETEYMNSLSVIVPIWTMADIKGEQLKGLMDAVANGVGLAGWQALPHVVKVLAACRAAGIPVVHLSQSEAIPGWRDRPRGPVDVTLSHPDSDRRPRNRT